MPIAIILLYLLVVSTLSQEQLLYSFDFSGPQDWIVYNGSIANQWLSWMDCNAKDFDLCLRIRGNAYISRIIPTIGYHSIRIQFDIAEQGLETHEDDYCYVLYRSAIAPSWKTDYITT